MTALTRTADTSTPSHAAGLSWLARAMLVFVLASGVFCAVVWLRDVQTNPWRYPRWDDTALAEVLDWTLRVAAVVYAIAGALILSRKPGHRVGAVCALFGLLLAVNDVLNTLPLLVSDYSVVLALFFAQRLIMGFIFPVPFIWLLLVFPSGEYQSRRWRAVAWVAALAWIQPVAYLLITPTLWLSHTDATVTNPFYVGNWATRARDAQLEEWLFGAFFAFSIALMGLALFGYVRRMRAANTPARRQMLWLALVCAMALFLFGVGVWAGYNGGGGWSFYMLGILTLLMGTPIAIVIAIVRHRLFETDVALNRALVYGGLVTFIVAAYVLIVGVLGAIFNSTGDVVLGVVATGIIAALFNPARERVQRVVNRALYGQRAEPAEALSRIHSVIASAPSSDAALQGLLKEIERDPVAAQHAARLMRDLQRSRERIVSAREEERRRLRRDLHDGLGPALASQTLKLDAALELIATHPDRARDLLQQAKRESQTTVGDVRRLVYGLRPPALDEQGLEGAVRAFGDGLGPLRVGVVVSALPPLPAAVEVAAYRIATEAMTNAAKHARATRCEVAIGFDSTASALKLEVSDDGRGLPRECAAGVGLRSMRERAEELGGSFAIESAPGEGVRVTARLPA